MKDINKPIKHEVIKLAKEYLKDNSYCDLTAIVADNLDANFQVTSFVRDIANQMKRTGLYEYIETGNGESTRYCIIPLPEKPFKEKYWYLISLGTLILGSVLTTATKIIDQKICPAQNATYLINLPNHDSVGRIIDTLKQRIEVLEKQKHDSI